MREINEDSFYDIQHDDILNERLTKLNINEVEFYKALEKQIPMKIDVEQWIYTKCECGKKFSIGGYDGYYRVPHENRTNYCSDCGQKLDWNE